MSIGTGVLNLMYGNPLAPLGGGPAALPQNRQGGPPAPVGTSSGGSGAPPPSPSPGAPQVPSPAAQSPPDLAQLYVQLAQRQQSANMIDRGLTTMAMANSTPSMQRALASSMPGAGGGGVGGMDIKSLMELQMMQQAANLPPPPGYSPQIWSGLNPMQRQEEYGRQATATGQEQTKLAETKQSNLLEAQQKNAGAIPMLQGMDDIANQIKGATDANGNQILAGIVGPNHAIKQAAAKAMIDAATLPAEKGGGFAGNLWHNAITNNVLTDDEKGLVQKIAQLSGQIYGEEFANAGSRRTQAEIKGLVSGANPLMNFNQPLDQYMNQFGGWQGKLHTSIANAYGESGHLDNIPEAYRWDENGAPRVGIDYRPNGSMYAGGGQWLNQPPVKVADDAGFAKLPSGALFIGPDGQMRKKP